MRFTFTAVVLLALIRILQDSVPEKYYHITLIMLAFAFISWLNYRLISRLFRLYKSLFVRFIYLSLTMSTIFVIGYGNWTSRPSFVAPEHEVYLFLLYGAVVWLVGQVTLAVLQPFIYIAHWLVKGNRAVDTKQTDSSTPEMTRRTFLYSTLAVTPLIALGNGAKGIYEAQCEMSIQRYSLAIPNLPHNLNGFKIGQVSDTHLGPYFNLARLDTVIQLLAKEKTDLVVITGDFADDLNLLRPAIDRFNNLQPSIPHGIYFCCGNHDYHRNIELVKAELHKSRIITLQNESMLIVPGPNPFYLMGVDYPWAANSHEGINVSVSKESQECFVAASRNVPLNAFKVLIAHHPDFLFDGFAAKVPLTLTGHTHGGQVVLWGKSLLSPYAYMRGLYQETGVYGYVSSGTGHWLPFRLGCPPEISVFTLQG